MEEASPGMKISIQIHPNNRFKRKIQRFACSSKAENICNIYFVFCWFFIGDLQNLLIFQPSLSTCFPLAKNTNNQNRDHQFSLIFLSPCFRVHLFFEALNRQHKAKCIKRTENISRSVGTSIEYHLS